MKTCARCGDKLIPRQVWRATPVEQREILRSMGMNMDDARGLCHRCYRYCTKHDLLADYERKTVPYDVVRDEWELFYNRAEPKAPQIRFLAPRLGMTFTALHKAVDALGRVQDS